MMNLGAFFLFSYKNDNLKKFVNHVISVVLYWVHPAQSVSATPLEYTNELCICVIIC